MLTENWLIAPTRISDLDMACALYDDAIDYQKRRGFPEYRWDDRETQARYIQNGTHYKVLTHDGIAAIFNIQPSDPTVWRHRDVGRSVYLHGVLVHTRHKGKGVFKLILDWVIDYARHMDKDNIRLDTWADNPRLTDYYEKHGFEMIEDFQIPATENVPLNCRGNKVSLMQYTLNGHG